MFSRQPERLVLAGTFIAMLAHPLRAENSVVIESRHFSTSQPLCSVGVFVANDIPIVALVLPLELRSITPGCYIANTIELAAIPGNRADNSPLGSAGPTWPPAIVVKFWYAETDTGSCSGPISGTYRTRAPAADFVSPDGLLYAAVSQGDPMLGEDYELAAGTDPSGTENASFLFRFGVGIVPGQFEIDTCCVRPSNHLVFARELPDGTFTILAPSFTPSLITIGCACACHADPECNGIIVDVGDVVAAVDVIFRGFAPVPDPNPACPHERVDVNCDGFMDIGDIPLLVDVAFRGFTAESRFCDPCL